MQILIQSQNEAYTSPEDEFYGDSLVLLEGAITELTSRLDTIRKHWVHQSLRDPIEHYKSRIKTADSMRDKLKRYGLPCSKEAALTGVFDAAGIRIICTFLDDVYSVMDMIKKQRDIEIVEEKDYIKNPKPNGYRSYHVICRVPVHLDNEVRRVYVEIQIRTIAMDCWASLEHQLKYKRYIPGQEIIVSELKRCADEIASTDVDLQTIRDMIDVK
jgi:putative GTP pyrophosphokinase